MGVLAGQNPEHEDDGLVHDIVDEIPFREILVNLPEKGPSS